MCRVCLKIFQVLKKDFKIVINTSKISIDPNYCNHITL